MSDENRPAGARPQQRESRAVGRAKPIKPGREMKQGAPGPKTTEQAGKARQAVQAAARNGQAKARFTQRAQQTAKEPSTQPNVQRTLPVPGCVHLWRPCTAY